MRDKDKEKINPETGNPSLPYVSPFYSRFEFDNNRIITLLRIITIVGIINRGSICWKEMGTKDAMVYRL